MMSRFTEKAQEVLQRAQQIMFAKQHTQLDVEHIFLALLRKRNSLAVRALDQLGVNTKEMEKELDRALHKIKSWGTHGSSSATGYITLRCNRVLQGAAEEADRLGADNIATIHLFLALSREQGGVTGNLLQDAGITYEKLLSAVPNLGDDTSEQVEYWHKPESREIKQIVNPESLARPVGFNHGILITGGRLLFLAGQTGIDADGKLVAPGDVVGQYRQILSNLQAVVEEAGGKMADIAKMTIFVKDRDSYLAHLKQLGQVHKEFFGAYYPATALLEVSRFFQEGVLVEVEGIAVLSAEG